MKPFELKVSTRQNLTKDYPTVHTVSFYTIKITVNFIVVVKHSMRSLVSEISLQKTIGRNLSSDVKNAFYVPNITKHGK